MSFSKARIQRFNELTSEAPPPGAYDPKFDNKLKGSKGDKKAGKFNDAKSTTSSGAECNGSVSSRSTSVSAKPFRTPQALPKKRVVVKPAGLSCPRMIKTKLYTESKESKTPYEKDQEVSDLKVECENKTKTIRENEKYIEEIKAEIQSLTEKYEILQKKHSQIEEMHQKDIESMATLQQEVLGNKNEKYQNEIKTLQSDLAAALKDKEELMEERTKVEKELKGKIEKLEVELKIHMEQDEIVEKMKNLEVATKKLDKMTQELNEALCSKNQEMSELLKHQLETESKLKTVEEELKKSEKQVADLEANLDKILAENNAQASTINQQLLRDMTEVLKDYFNYDGKWTTEAKSFHPDVEDFLLNVKKFVTELKSIYEREIELSRDNFNEERENLEQELELKRNLIVELENKQSEVNETNNFLTEELQDTQKLYKDVKGSLMELKSELELANEKYTKAVTAHKAELELTAKIHAEELNKLKDLLEEARSEYLKELENMTTARNEELAEVKQAMEKRIEDEKKRMKECANKMIENAEAVTRETLKACRAESEERVRRVLAETEAKISLVTREVKSACDEELRLTTEKFNSCLDRLENEKESISDKLAQRDLDVIRLTAALEEMKCTSETQESFSQSLQAELDRAEAELVEKKDELRNLKDQIRTESAEMVARKRLLEVVMAENQASIAALTRRLAQSETEVERLQRELQAKEGYRDLFETMSENSRAMQEQLDMITDKIEEKAEHIDQMEQINVSEINAVKMVFSDKIDSLKSYTIEELARAQRECKEVLELNSELKDNLHMMSEKLNEATDMLLKLEEVNDKQAIDLAKLQSKNAKLHQQLDEKNRIIKENQVNFEKYQEQHKIEMDEIHQELSKFKEEIKVFEQKKIEVEEKKYDFEEMQFKHQDEIKSLTEKLDRETSEREKFEEKLKEYEKTCERLTEDYKKLSEKHQAESSANINSRQQKTKHVSQLKEKISVQQLDLMRLRQELDTKSSLVDELKLANEKLKQLDRPGLGKENLHSSLISSPSTKSTFPRSSGNTPISSPLKPHTPLRDRND